MSEPTDFEVQRLLNRLQRPLFIYKMANGEVHLPDGPRRRGALTRKRNALQEAREVLELLGWRYEGAEREREIERYLPR